MLRGKDHIGLGFKGLRNMSKNITKAHRARTVWRTTKPVVVRDTWTFIYIRIVGHILLSNGQPRLDSVSSGNKRAT